MPAKRRPAQRTIPVPVAPPPALAVPQNISEEGEVFNLDVSSSESDNQQAAPARQPKARPRNAPAPALEDLHINDPASVQASKRHKADDIHYFFDNYDETRIACKVCMYVYFKGPQIPNLLIFFIERWRPQTQPIGSTVTIFMGRKRQQRRLDHISRSITSICIRHWPRKEAGRFFCQALFQKLGPSMQGCQLSKQDNQLSLSARMRSINISLILLLLMIRYLLTHPPSY
jgi:hypothetical protein